MNDTDSLVTVPTDGRQGGHQSRRFRRLAVPLLVIAVPLGVILVGSLPAPSDPNLPTQPLFSPTVNGKVVTIETLSLNGEKVPASSLEAAVKGFGRYVAGEVRLVTGESFELKPGIDGALSRRQIEEALLRCENKGLSTIVLVVAPDVDFQRRSGACHWPGNFKNADGHVIVIGKRSAERISSRVPPFARERCWEMPPARTTLAATGVERWI